MGRASTRVAVHEEGIWRFQPALGSEYQIRVDAEPSCSAEACRSRSDVCQWCPDRAAAEGIDVELYLQGAQMLNAAAHEPRVFSPEGVLKCVLCMAGACC